MYFDRSMSFCHIKQNTSLSEFTLKSMQRCAGIWFNGNVFSLYFMYFPCVFCILTATCFSVTSGESALTTVGEFTLTPILAVLMTVGAALILVFVLIAAYFCVRRGPGNHGNSRRKPSDNRISYTETHIPLQKGIDDCIDDHNSGGTALTPMLPDHERNPDIIPIARRGKYVF